MIEYIHCPECGNEAQVIAKVYDMDYIEAIRLDAYCQKCDTVFKQEREVEK